MKISGNDLATPIREHIFREASTLKANNIYPHLAIVTLGEEDTWQTYVNQKLKWAEKLSLFASLHPIENATTDKVLEMLEKLNADETVHGIIVQRPFSHKIDKQKVIDAIEPVKDVDGFRPDSPYEVPVWKAVEHILEYISQGFENSLREYLIGKDVVVIGKGETAGQPCINGLTALGAHVAVVDSKTENSYETIKKGDIIISCVGKTLIRRDDMHEGQVIIGVGIRKENGKLKGDFDEHDAEASGVVYTPTPGGVGPLNLTFLLQNVLQATQLQRASEL